MPTRPYFIKPRAYARRGVKNPLELDILQELYFMCKGD